MVVQFGEPCALCEWWLRPLAAILGSGAEDVSGPRSSGGRGVALEPGASTAVSHAGQSADHTLQP